MSALTLLAEARTVAEAIRAATAILGPRTDTARLDAELLMAQALGTSRSDLFLRRMGDAVPDSFAGLVTRRAGHEPVAYIRGRQEFFGLEFEVSPAVLIPRADSEVLVETALAQRPAARRVLDCGTGSGALLLAVLNGLEHGPGSGAEGTGIDRSAAALMLARRNAGRLGLAERTRWAARDWHQPGWNNGLGRFDLILANPPYVEDHAPIAASVREFEPAEALFAGPQGLDDYRVLVPQLPQLLAPGGLALVEIGAGQAAAVSAIARGSGLDTRLYRDLGERPRALALQIPLGKDGRNR